MPHSGGTSGQSVALVGAAALISHHQLRHSCAALLLNAGAPVVSVQALLGHEKVDTTLGYARLYDGTLAADYCRAMGQIEFFRLQPIPSDILYATISGHVGIIIDLRNEQKLWF